MRLVHCADLHLGLSRFHMPGQPHSRLDDFAATAQRFVTLAADEGADLAIIAGDLFDSRHPRPRELAVAATFLQSLARTCPTVLVPGNHDGMWNIGDPDSATLRFLGELNLPGLHPMLMPGAMAVNGAAVVGIPYPHKRAYDSVYPGQDPFARQEALRDHLSMGIDLMREGAEQAHPGHVLIFAGHVGVAGATVGSERAMRLEDDILLGTEVFEPFDYAALGHLHRQQRVAANAWYAGAPEFVSFNELGDPKGFLVVDVTRGERPKVRQVQSGARQMILLPFDASGAKVKAISDLHVSAKVPAGAIVRVRLTLDARPPAAALRTLVDGLYAAGASYVDTEVIVPAARPVAARALRVGATDTEAVRSWLAVNGYEEQPYLTAAEEVFHGSTGGG